MYMTMVSGLSSLVVHFPAVLDFGRFSLTSKGAELRLQQSERAGAQQLNFAEPSSTSWNNDN
jgi:hypothetical protein